MKIFITGVSSGIGETLTKKLIKDGHEVWGIARRPEALEELRKELNSELLHLLQCDLENLDDMKKIVDEMRDKNFLPDIIVLNAAVNLQNPLNTFDFGIYHKSFDIIDIPGPRLCQILFIHIVGWNGNLRNIIKKIVQQNLDRQHRQKWQKYAPACHAKHIS